MPYIFIGFWLGIIIIVYRTQRYIYGIDMEVKRQQKQIPAEQ